MIINKIYNFKNGLKYSITSKVFFDNDNNIIKLNVQEISLIEILLKQSEEYISFGTLQSVIGKKDSVSIDSLRTLVRGIRKKTYSDIISNLSGVGYKINLDISINKDKVNILIADDEKINLEFLKLTIDKHIANVNLLFAHKRLIYLKHQKLILHF